VNLRERIETRSVRGLVRASCVLALAGLAVLCFSVLVPRPIPVIFAMSVGQVIGVGAFSSYLLAVVLDAARREGRGTPPHDDGLLGVNVEETRK
jgi:hypothetical protein